MGVAFYLQDPRFWSDAFHRANYRLGMPIRVFEETLQRFALYAKANGTGVKWS
jgi:hypothetical protein